MVQNPIVQQQGGIRPIRPKVHADGLARLQGGACVHDQRLPSGQDVLLKLPLGPDPPLMVDLQVSIRFESSYILDPDSNKCCEVEVRSRWIYNGQESCSCFGAVLDVEQQQLNLLLITGIS